MIKVFIRKFGQPMRSGALHLYTPTFNAALNEIGEAYQNGFSEVVIFADEGQFATMPIEKLALKFSQILNRPAFVHDDQIRFKV
jgi:hypothetical protein